MILADVGLNFPDYRAAERAFQLLTQVAGRAGRSTLGGKAILQTFQPEHYAIRFAAQHDYLGFYEVKSSSYASDCIREALGQVLFYSSQDQDERIKKLVHGESITDGNHQRLDMLTTTLEGETAGTFYGYVTDGIFQNLTELNSHSDEHGNLLQPQAEPGDFRFSDINNDGILNDNDKRVIGNPEPDFTYGINGYMNYKGIEFNLLFTGSYGNDVLNALRPYSATGEGYYNSEKGLLERGWNGENSTSTQPVIKAVDQNQNFRYSDYFIEDGSYIRLKNVQLAYNLPERILTPVKIKKAKIYISAENVYTFTPFSGLDPDMGGRPTERGIDWGHYPLPKRFTIGLKLTL